MNDKMNDAELSKILGRYQAAESIGIFLGALCVIAGCVLAFVLHELIVVLILGFSGVVLLLLIALPAQKKKNALIWQQLGGYFGAELKRFFGEEPEKPELPIDYRFLKNVGLIGIKWTECRVKRANTAACGSPPPMSSLAARSRSAPVPITTTG